MNYLATKKEEDEKKHNRKKKKYKKRRPKMEAQSRVKLERQIERQKRAERNNNCSYLLGLFKCRHHQNHHHHHRHWAHLLCTTDNRLWSRSLPSLPKQSRTTSIFSSSFLPHKPQSPLFNKSTNALLISSAPPATSLPFPPSNMPTTSVTPTQQQTTAFLFPPLSLP